MKSFKRFIALALCAVMLVGIAPMAFNSAVVAVDEASSGVDAVVQGPNDAVVVYDNEALVLREAFRAFVGNKILAKDGNKYGVGGTTSGAAYDRIIFVIATNERLGSKAATAFESSISGYFFTDCENIVITSKCYAEHTENIYVYSGEPYELNKLLVDDLIKYENSGKTDLFKNNLIDKTDSVELRVIENGNAHFVRVASDISFEYITLKFDVNVLFYLAGYDFYVSDTVKFTHVDTSDGYKPIIVNGTNGDASKRMYYYNPEKTQTITLNGGEYQYIVPRTRNLTYRTFKDYDITINLGEVTFVRNSDQNVAAFFSNDYFENTKINVNINGTTFKAPVYLVQGSTNSLATAPTVKGCTLNINVNNADFQKGVAVVAPCTATAACDVQSLAVNMRIESCTVGSGYTIEGQTKDTDTAITAKIEYTEGAKFGASIGSFDTTTTFAGDLCASGHTYEPMVVEGECCYACVNCSKVDETKVVTFDQETGCPVIYVRYTGGDDANDGLTKETPVANTWKATEILAEWKKGGYIAYVGSSTQQFKDHTTIPGSNHNCYLLSDVGGTLYIDGNYKNINGAEGTQSVITSASANVFFENDTVMKNIKLTDVSEHKTFILNYNDFIAVDNCTAASKNKYNYTLITGTFNVTGDVIINYATNEEVDQTVNIDGFCFQTIMTGSKSIQKDSTTGTPLVRFSQEYSKNCSGVTRINIGENSKVDAINARKYRYDEQNTTERLTDYSAPDVRITLHKNAIPDAGIKFVLNSSRTPCVREYIADTASSSKYMFADDRALIIYGDDFSDIASVLTVVDHEAFVYVTNGYNEAISSARITFAEVDDSLQGDEIAEFGVLFCASEFNEWPNYVYAEGDQGLVAKSVCYDKAKNIENYLYDGENAASFRGVIKLDKEQYYDLDFAAVPYALVKVAAATDVVDAVAAEYCVIGMPEVTSFAEIIESAN